MVKIFYIFFSVIILGFIHANAPGQSECTPEKPLAVQELKGRILFESNTALFSVKDAEVSISEKGKEAFYGILDVKPNSEGYFEVKSLKPGKYYLSIQSMVGFVSLMEFEIKTVPVVNDNRVEFILSGLGGKCSIKTVKTFDAKPYQAQQLRGNGKRFQKYILNERVVMVAVQSIKLASERKARQHT